MNYFFKRIALLSVAAFLFVAQAVAGELEDRLSDALREFVPANVRVGDVAVKKVAINKKKKTVTVTCNVATSYLPFTPASVADLQNRLAQELPSYARYYNVKIVADGHPIEELALGAKRRNVGPKEKTPFVTRHAMPEISAGLQDANIALWQSHGWYYERKLNRWEWQRARIFQTVEDLYTQSYVMPFLMPMLENAGAYVMSPRERDVNTFELIVDPDGDFAYSEGYVEKSGSKEWTDGGVGFGYVRRQLLDGDNPFTDGRFRKVSTVDKPSSASSVTWSADIPEQGDYAVYVSYATLPSSTDATYTVHSLRGDEKVTVNQRMGGGTWIYLGHFPLPAGKSDVVTLDNVASRSGVITADAVKIGGGMGNVARQPNEPLDDIDYEPVLSGYPRFTEGARYWLQWAGIPEEVYSPQERSNDYTDDYQSRGIWVNYLAGGSSMVPDEKGLGIPVDLSFAFHSDAGTTLGDTIIGTLGIYCTEGGKKTGNGSTRLASRDLTDLVVTQIVNDVRSGFEPEWTRRGLWDRSYAEARIPQVPAMLLELLSHQNFADMKYGLDPTFRFTVSRAIYKAMLRFLADRDGRPYVVQSLPVRSFAISRHCLGGFELTWKETVDTLESTATPTYYIVEQRINSGAFRPVARVESPSYRVTDVMNDSIYSYRIIAGNDGGLSFPSEVLACAEVPGDLTDVMVVNGFTRVSAPDWFDSGEIAGFYDARDHGMPYVKDISYIGPQTEFRREIPWMDDDASGFGDSRGNYETTVIAGNTFDFVYVHGQAIAAAGHSFVSSSAEAYACSDVASDPMILDLILGKQKETMVGRGAVPSRYKAFTPALQAKIRAHVERGGDVFVSGSYVATDIWDNPLNLGAQRDADIDFAQNVLGYTWRTGQASITGEAIEVNSRFRQFKGGVFPFNTTLGPDCYAVESPDSFYATDSSQGATIIRYSENNLVAGVAVDKTSYRTVIIGFPFETIKADSRRDLLMRQVLDFFTPRD